MLFDVNVIIKLKGGMLSPEAKAISHALSSLGMKSEYLNTAKFFEIGIEAENAHLVGIERKGDIGIEPQQRLRDDLAVLRIPFIGENIQRALVIDLMIEPLCAPCRMIELDIGVIGLKRYIGIAVRAVELLHDLKAVRHRAR